MTVVDPRLAGKPVPRISRETMERGHTARASAKGSDLAFLDQRLPAYEREIINTVGMGITENPALRPDVKAGAKGISITYVRAAPAPPCDLGSVHGRWQVFWLEGDDERTLDLDEGDLCNVPIGIYRGFRNVSNHPDALLIAIVGGPDAGKVGWHPSVVVKARKSGPSVDDDSNLIVAKPAA